MGLKNKREKGQSLIGVVIFAIILMILVLGATGATVLSFTLNKRLKDRAEAQDIAKNIIETIKVWAGNSLDNFQAIKENEKPGTQGAIPAIPTISPAIPVDPSSGDMIYTQFLNIPQVNGSPKYAIQFLIKDYYQPGTSTVILKRITIRVYYANRNGKINTNFHKPGSGSPPKRYENPLAEIVGVISRP